MHVNDPCEVLINLLLVKYLSSKNMYRGQLTYNLKSFTFKRAIFFIGLLCVSFGIHAQPIAALPDTFASSDPFISWAKDHAFPLQNSDAAKGDADLKPIKKMIGSARVVALGEPAHGLHTPIAFRNRLFKFLVENCGFTTIVIEAGLAESRLADAFVTEGRGTPEAAEASLNIDNPSSENIELMQWMRQYNKDPAHTRKIKFYGMDMQLKGFPGDTRPSHDALDEALAYLRRVDTSSANQVITALSPYINTCLLQDTLLFLQRNMKS